MEYLGVTVTANVVLDSQPVSIAFDRDGTWHPATWIGVAGTTRTAQVLVNDSIIPTSRSATSVYVRVTDNPEVPIIRAGQLEIL